MNPLKKQSLWDFFIGCILLQIQLPVAIPGHFFLLFYIHKSCKPLQQFTYWLQREMNGIFRIKLSGLSRTPPFCKHSQQSLKWQFDHTVWETNALWWLVEKKCLVGWSSNLYSNLLKPEYNYYSWITLIRDSFDPESF